MTDQIITWRNETLTPEQARHRLNDLWTDAQDAAVKHNQMAHDKATSDADSLALAIAERMKK